MKGKKNLFLLFAFVLPFYPFVISQKYGFIHVTDEDNFFFYTTRIVVPETPDDTSFELTPSLVLLKQQRNCIRMMLMGVSHTIAACKLDHLFDYQFVVNNIFSMGRLWM